MRASTEQDFQAYVRPLTPVSYFKYLGRFLTALDDDWPAVVGNYRKEQAKWACFSRILRQEGANAQVSGVFFKVVFRVVLLFISEMWVMTPHMVQALGFFQHRVYRQIIGRQPRSI